jgi:hypothetical protein
MKQKFLAIIAVLSAAAFFLFRLFSKEPKTSEDFPQSEKNRLLKEKKQLEQSQSDLDKKVYSDKEIEDKFNK